MKNGIVLNAKKIVDKAFTISLRGYAAREVDEFLDTIASDYDTFDANIAQLKKANDLLKIKNDELLLANTQLEAQIALLSNKLGNIKDNTEVSRSNIDLLNRISILENVLHEMGVDPTKIK